MPNLLQLFFYESNFNKDNKGKGKYDCMRRECCLKSILFVVTDCAFEAN